VKTFLGAKYNLNFIYRYNPYDVRESYDILKESILDKDEDGHSYLEKYNIILNSLGAKISAISLFKLWLSYPQLALSYIPSKEYNKDYSSGIGEGYSGQI